MVFNLENCRNDLCADARSQRGLVTSLESDARGKEGLVNALRHLTSHSLPLGSPSLARLCDAKLPLRYRERGEYQGFSF